jgi:hypothetical protein
MAKYKHHYDLWYIDRHNEATLIDWSEEFKDRVLKKYGEKKMRKSVLGG